MTIGEVIDKLSREQALALGDYNFLPICKIYIQMALSIGIEHFTKDMEEVIVLYKDGEEAGRFKSITEASEKLGIYRPCIQDVIAGKAHTAGGLMFMKIKDKELIKKIC